ncbi:MAG: DNA polymerase Y family protein [Planctomycetota bacterium]
MPASDSVTGPRIACVDVPALPLQLVLRSHPEWGDEPVVVVEHDRPDARILWANRRARALQVRRGQRCREAEALASRLHAEVLPAAELERAGIELLRLLFDFSPAVEPVPDEPGLFFVDARGLHELFTGLEAWAQALHGALGARGFVAAVVVGFARFATYAVARGRTGWLVLTSCDQEQRLAAATPFAALSAPRPLHERMQALGIRTLGEFLALPAPGLRRRFGKAAQELHTRATVAWAPLAPAPVVDPVRFEGGFELADADLERFLVALTEGLRRSAEQVEARRETIAALRLSLVLEHAPVRQERFATAVPTLDLTQFLELVRLRFAVERLAGPIERFAVELESVAVVPAQRELLATVRRRDPAAAARALARLAAAFGEHAVTRARLVPSHLPELGFTWESVRTVTPPRPPAARRDGQTPLVRTLRHVPEPLGTLPVHEPEAWLGEYGAVQRAHGPFRTSALWWRQPVERDYFFLETDRGAILWVFHDRRSRRWYLHGRVD